MKKLATLTIATIAMAGAVFAAPELTDENIAAVTAALETAGYTVGEISVDGEHYLVAVSMDDAESTVLLTEDFQIVEQ